MNTRQRDTAARMLADVIQLPPDERVGVVAIVVRVLAGSGVGDVTHETRGGEGHEVKGSER